MKNIKSKIIKMIKEPKSIWRFGISKIQKMLFLREISKDGNIYYKYKNELYPGYLNNGNAAGYIKEKALEYCKGKGLDIGASSWPLDGAIPIDNTEEQNAYKLDRFEDSSLDFVFSSHCLEHLDNWQQAIKLWLSKLKPGGILFLYLPHKSQKLWLPGSPWVGHAHRWSPTYEVINQFLLQNNMEILEYNKDKDEYWSFHIIARKKQQK